MSGELGARLKAARQAAGLSVPDVAIMFRDLAPDHVRRTLPSKLSMIRTIRGHEAGDHSVGPRYRALWAMALDIHEEELFGTARVAGNVAGVDVPGAKDMDELERRAMITLLAAVAGGSAIPTGVLDRLFSGVDQAAGGSVDLAEWERVAHEYPYRMNASQTGSVVGDLTADLMQLGRLLQVPRSPAVQSGLLRVSAGLSGLLAAEFENVGQRRAARVAWGVARRGADTCGDRDLQVWLRAREAQLGVYSGRPAHAVRDLANEAIELASSRPSTGLARAHASLVVLAAEDGDSAGAAKALAACEAVTARQPTGFVDGWGEKNLVWTEGYAQTFIGVPQTSVDKALMMYPKGTLGAVTSLRLMTALNLVRTGDVQNGLDHAVTSLHSGDTGGAVRQRLADQIIAALPRDARKLDAVQELRTLTATPA